MKASTSAFGLVHEGGKLRQLGPELVRDTSPLRLGGLGSGLREGGGSMKAETTLRLLFPAWGSALRMVWTRQRRQVAFISLARAPVMPSWASEMTSPDLIWGLTPRLGATPELA